MHIVVIDAGDDDGGDDGDDGRILMVDIKLPIWLLKACMFRASKFETRSESGSANDSEGIKVLRWLLNMPVTNMSISSLKSRSQACIHEMDKCYGIVKNRFMRGHGVLKTI